MIRRHQKRAPGITRCSVNRTTNCGKDRSGRRNHWPLAPAQRENPSGRPEPFNWRSPFLIGVSAAAGVALTYSAVQLLLAASKALLLVTLSLFLAIGLEPAVSWMVTRGIPRWAGVTTVLGTVLAFIAAFVAGRAGGHRRP